MDARDLIDCPSLPPNYAFRPHLVSTVLTLLDGKTNAVVLEGQPGMGYTCFLAEMVRSPSIQALHLFINSASRLAYSPEYLADILATQAEQLLSSSAVPRKGVEIDQADDQHTPSSARLRRALIRLHRRYSAIHKDIFILVDGLHQVPPEDRSYVDEILKEILPFGIPSFRFVITVANTNLASRLPKTVGIRPFVLISLSPNECEILLNNANLALSISDDLYKITKGHPSKVASAFRLLQAGKDISSLSGSELGEFFIHEWNAIPTQSKELEDAIAYVTFSRRPVELAAVVDFSGCSKSAILELAGRESFIRFGTSENVVELIGDSQRRFLEQRLQDKKPQVVRALIDELVTNPKSPLALRFLPTYFESIHRSRDIVKYLRPDTLEMYLEDGQSVSELLRQTEAGLRAAKQADELQDTLRFALNVSFVRNADSSDVWAPRLMALTALDRFEEAYAVTQIPATQEERLFLLSLYAKAAYEAKLPKDAAIEERVKAVCDAIDIAALGDRAEEIAINLVGFFPSLALSLIEKMSGAGHRDRDQAYAHLSLQTGLASRDADKSGLASKEYLARIKDSSVQTFATAAEAVLSGRSPEEFRTAIQQLEGRDRLYFTQRWLVVNCKQEGACDLIEDALQSLVSDTKYLPTAIDLMEIASPLVYSSDLEVVRSLLRRIDGHRGAISSNAPTIDMLKLDIQLARIEARTDLAIAGDRLIRMSFDAMGHNDKGAQLECYARLLRATEEVDPEHILEKREGFRKIFSEGIDKTLGLVLGDSAEHFEVLKGVFRAFAEFDPARGLVIAAQLNTEISRQRACRFLAVEALRHGVRPVSIAFLVACLDSIADEEVATDTLGDICGELSIHTPNLDGTPRPLLDRCVQQAEGVSKANLLIAAININEHYKAGLNTDVLLDAFHARVCEVDPIWQRRKIGYRMVVVLKKHNPARAEKYFQRFWKDEQSFGVMSANLADSHQYLLRLTIAAWASLLRKRRDTDEELIRITSLIADIPSFRIQARLMADICERAWIKKRQDILDKVCQQFVVPLVDMLNGKKVDAFHHAVLVLFPSLYLWRQSLALNYIRETTKHRKEIAIGNAIEFVITKRPLSEPFSDPQYKGVTVTYDEAKLCVDLISQLDTDSDIGSATEILTKTLGSPGSRRKVTETQRAEIAQNLAEIVDSKLPDIRNIKHEGWKVLCMIRIEKLRNPKGLRWDDFLQRAMAIPNCADRVFILAELADEMPAKRRDLAVQAFQRARGELQSIPAAVDRMKRAIFLSKCSFEDARSAAEGLLMSALTESLTYPDEEIATRSRRAAIDAANQIDEELAKRLVNVIDDDPARMAAKAEAKQQLKAETARKAVVEARQDVPGLNSDYLAKACWDALGSLNAGRCAARKPSQLSSLIDIAASKEIGDTFPIFLWYLRNLEVRLEATAESDTTLRLHLEVLLMVADLATRIVKRLCHRERWTPDEYARPLENMIVSPADRDRAINKICEWTERMEGDEILICDPYFGTDDLELVRQIHFRRTGLKFTILISPQADVRGKDLRDAFQSGWTGICDAKPPPIRVVIVMFRGTHKGAIHDRWIMGSESALRLGTSVNGLGASRWSEISVMENAETSVIREELLRFSRMQEWFVGAVQVDYEVAGIQ